MDISSTNHLSAIDAPIVLMQSTVIKVEPLQIKDGIAASLAISCLIQPELGDTVACATNENGEVFILSVLKRLNPDATLLISSKNPISIDSPYLNLTATKIEVVAEEMASNIGMLKRLITHAEDIVGSLVASYDRIFVRANSSIRRVEELDELSAGHVKIDSPALVEISGEVTTISGEELIKMQGQQIHMG